MQSLFFTNHFTLRAIIHGKFYEHKRFFVGLCVCMYMYTIKHDWQLVEHLKKSHGKWTFCAQQLCCIHHKHAVGRGRQTLQGARVAPQEQLATIVIAYVLCRKETMWNHELSIGLVANLHLTFSRQVTSVCTPTSWCWHHNLLPYKRCFR